jgi:hypothetical protein
MKCIVLLIVILLAPLQLIAQGDPPKQSIFDLSNTITKTKGSVSVGSEVITMVSEKKVTLTRDITLQRRYLLYEDKFDQKSSTNFHDILLRKNNEIVYKYNYGNNPDYRIIRLEKNKIALVLLGGFSHDGRIEVFHVQDGALTKTNSYTSESEEFEDMDHDGISEMLIADPHSYLLPKGALSASVGLWIVLKYENGFKYSPKLTKQKYRSSLNIGNIKCDLENRDRVEDCGKVIENIILNSHLGDINSVAKAIRRNMVFRDKNEKVRFIDEYATWFFDTQFIDEIKAYTGIQSPSKFAADLLAKTEEHGN